MALPAMELNIFATIAAFLIRSHLPEAKGDSSGQEDNKFAELG